MRRAGQGAATHRVQLALRLWSARPGAHPRHRRPARHGVGDPPAPPVPRGSRAAVMRPDTAFEHLGPMAQFREVTRLMPPWDEVYAWWQDRDNRDTWYCAVENYWFRSVSGPDCPYRTFLDDLVFKPDVDRDAALHHVKPVLGSCV